MKGCYCLIINLSKNSKIKIGKLGKIDFKKGHYIYIGSAMNSLESRLKRHLSDDKKLHWHIDYLLKNKNSKIEEIIYNLDKKVECEISDNMNSSYIQNFGCSDCECESHLYYFKNKKEAIESVKNAYKSIAVEYLKYEI